MKERECCIPGLATEHTRKLEIFLNDLSGLCGEDRWPHSFSHSKEQEAMPINFQQIYARIREIAAGVDDSKRTLEEKRELARKLLATYASELDYLQRKVEEAKAVDSNIRCAVPLDEPLTATYPPPPPAADVTVIAADGSQINPDRHASIQFSIINVGIIILKLHSGRAPEICVETEMLYGDDLISNGNPISDGMVAMRRDISERMKLEEVSKDIPGPVVNLTDGTIELWGAKGDDPQAYADFVEKYLRVLTRLHSRSVITSGYVENQGATGGEAARDRDRRSGTDPAPARLSASARRQRPLAVWRA
jgi:hypothetical protein